MLELQVEGRVPAKERKIVVYCAGGTRSALAAQALGQLGYTDVASMAGGFNKWKDEGRDWVVPRTLDAPSATAISATSSCPRSEKPASSVSWSPRSYCSEPVGSGLPPLCT